LVEAAQGWERQFGSIHSGEGWVANIVDLGRPPVLGLLEPARELERIQAELTRLTTAPVG
jgi:hypothetical protein